jgi:pimeloyl-ACP methyl ester carboxylesterase
MKVPALAWREALRGLIDYSPSDGEFPELARIAVPTLIIWGALDEIFSREQQGILNRKIPGSQLMVFDQAGHAPNWEFPSKVADAITEFVSATT